MTNSEAIKILEVERIFRNGSNTKVEAIDLAISALEENTKLKAEIERLKAEVLANKNWSDVVKRTLKKEIDKNEQLKSELEQSVKLPCKVGDVIYDNDFGSPTPSTIVGYSFGDVYQDSDLEMDMEQIYFYSKSNRFNIDTSFPISEIGRTIFLTREEAEHRKRTK